MSYNPSNPNGQATSSSSSPVVIASDQPGVQVRTNATRNSGTAHRVGITSADKIASVGTITLTGTTGGSLVAGTTYYVSASAYNAWGNSSAAAVVNTSPGGSNTVMRCAFNQVTGADGYDIFLSADVAAPKWVGRITETQRASGIIINGVGTTTAGGTAGAVDVRVVGTQLQSTIAPFPTSNAYTPASVTPIVCAGYATAWLNVSVTVTDLRTIPTLVLIPFMQNQLNTALWEAGDPITVQLLATTGQPLQQYFPVDLHGATNLVVLVDSIGGQGTSASVGVDLA